MTTLASIQYTANSESMYEIDDILHLQQHQHELQNQHFNQLFQQTSLPLLAVGNTTTASVANRKRCHPASIFDVEPSKCSGGSSYVGRNNSHDSSDDTRSAMQRKFGLQQQLATPDFERIIMSDLPKPVSDELQMDIAAASSSSSLDQPHPLYTSDPKIDVRSGSLSAAAGEPAIAVDLHHRHQQSGRRDVAGGHAAVILPSVVEAMADIDDEEAADENRATATATAAKRMATDYGRQRNVGRSHVSTNSTAVYGGQQPLTSVASQSLIFNYNNSQHPQQQPTVNGAAGCHELLLRGVGDIYQNADSTGSGGGVSWPCALTDDTQTVPCVDDRTTTTSPIDHRLHHPYRHVVVAAGVHAPVDDPDRTRQDKKRERNRLAAQKCRQRKLEQIDTLQGHVDKLKGRNEELERTAEMLRHELQQLRREISIHRSSGCHLQLNGGGSDMAYHGGLV